MAAFWPPTMLTQEQAVEIRVMARRGMAIRELARELGCSRNTVKRYLRDVTASRYGPRSPRPTKLDPFKAYLRERIAAVSAGMQNSSVVGIEFSPPILDQEIAD